MVDHVRPQVVPMGELANAATNIQRAALLAALREQPVSRSDLARSLNLSSSAVSRLAHSLLADDWLVEAGTDAPPIGRPRTRLQLNGAIGHIITTLLESDQMPVRVVDAAGGLLVSASVPIEVPVSPELIASELRNLVESSGISSPTLAVGFSAPGVVDASGAVLAAPDLGWDSPIDLGGVVRNEFHCTVTIDNDVNLMLLAERVAGVIDDDDTAVFFYHGMRGIGLGVMYKGELLLGADGALGEIGLVPLNLLDASRKPSTLEANYSMAAIKDRLERLGVQVTPSPIKALVKAASAGNDGGLLDELMLVVARAVELVSLLFNPNLVIIGGGLRRALCGSTAHISTKFSGMVPSAPRILISQLGETELQLAVQTKCWDSLLLEAV